VEPLPVLINPLEEPDWDLFVGRHPKGAIYHHSSWLKVLLSTYPQLSVAGFAVKNPDGSIRSALPFCTVKNRRKAISIPFTPRCDPLVDSREDLDLLLRAVTDMVDDNVVSSWEFRTLRVSDFVGTSLVEADYHHKTHVLSLDGGIERVRKSFHRSCIARPIRKALNLGVVVRDASSHADLRVFFQLHARTRQRLGLPIQPIAFFTNMWRLMYPEQLTLFIAEYEGRPVSSLLAFSYKETVSLEYLGYDARELHAHPNHLLYYAAIEKACEEGFSLVDFGNTSPDNEGLLQFKRRWGTQEGDICYFYYPSVPKSSSVDDHTLTRKMFGTISRALPLQLACAAGQVIYDYVGVL
jgi:hypothetical protein